MKSIMRTPDNKTYTAYVYLLMKKPDEPCDVCGEFGSLLYGIFSSPDSEEPVFVRCNKHLFAKAKEKQA